MSEKFKYLSDLLEEFDVSRATIYRWCKKCDITIRKTKRGRSALTLDDYNKLGAYFLREDEEDELLPLETPLITEEVSKGDKEPKSLDELEIGEYRFNLKELDELTKDKLLEFKAIYDDPSTAPFVRSKTLRRAIQLIQ